MTTEGKVKLKTILDIPSTSVSFNMPVFFAVYPRAIIIKEIKKLILIFVIYLIHRAKIIIVKNKYYYIKHKK